MFKFLFPFALIVVFSLAGKAQILDSTRIKTPKTDTLVFVTQQDVNDYVLLRKVADTVGNLENYVRIIKNAKEFLALSKTSYERALQFAEQNEKLQNIYKTSITAFDVNEYLLIRKIVGDTTGKTDDYRKIIKSAKIMMGQGQYMSPLYKEIDYETALKNAEENLRLRSMVDKVLVIKSERKMYLQKKGKTIKSYSISLGPQPLGQKEYEGDGKTPEGIYRIDYQKWNSPSFHSFHISYPNETDLIRAKKKGLTPGTNIMIHGTSKGIKKKKDWTNGCIALNNIDMMEFRKLVFLETTVEIRK